MVITDILKENNELRIRRIILDRATKDKQIVYGSRAYNAQSPTYLKKSTTDYDILTHKPKKVAKEVVAELKRVLREEVELVKARHKGTYKVKVAGKTVADYTQLKKAPKTKKYLGTRYRDIKSIKRDARRLVKKKGTEYRREKDLDTLSRIKEIERIDRAFSF